MSGTTLVDFTMPSLGADMESARLVEWLRAVGDKVSRGDLIATVETDKGIVDVEVFEDGIVEELLAQPGAEVDVGAVLARIRCEEAQPQRGSPASPAAAPEAGVPVTPPPRGMPGSTPPAPRPTPPPTTSSPHVRALPAARKLASRLGVDLAAIQGSGPDGVVTPRDVERVAGGRPLDAPRGAAAPGGGMQGAIAAAMARSKREIPHYYLSHTVDVEPVLGVLERRNADRPLAERVLVVAAFVRAVALGLRAVPTLCGYYRDEAFEPCPGLHVGLAVSLRGGGLVNPAILDADQGSLSQLFARIRDVTERARSGRLRSSELASGGITVTNLGDRGVRSVFGVILPPQVAIVGFGAVLRRPWVVDGPDGAVVEIRRTVELTLSADHRVTNGHAGARFLRAVESALATEMEFE